MDFLHSLRLEGENSLGTRQGESFAERPGCPPPGAAPVILNPPEADEGSPPPYPELSS